MELIVKIIASIPDEEDEALIVAAEYTRKAARRLGIVTSYKTTGCISTSNSVMFERQIVIEGPVNPDTVDVHELMEDFREFNIRPVLLIFLGGKLIWNGDWDARMEEYAKEREAEEKATSDSLDDRNAFFKLSKNELERVEDQKRASYRRGPVDTSQN